MTNNIAARASSYLRSDEGRLYVLVSLMAGFCLMVDTKHGVRRDGYLEPAWTMCVYVVLPVAAAIPIDAKERLRATTLSLICATIAFVPIAHRIWVDGGKRYYFNNPEMMILPAAVGTLAVIASARASSTSLSEWGLGFGDWRWWGPRTGGLILAIIPFLAIAAIVAPELREFYPEYRPARESLLNLFKYQIGNGVYLFGWEFFFRGFLLFGVTRIAGLKAAILLQAIPFMLLHKGKPEIEMASSFIGAMMLGWFCWRGRSFWPAFLLHWCLNATMEIIGFFW